MSEALVPTDPAPPADEAGERPAPTADRLASGSWAVTGEHAPVWPAEVRAELAERRRVIEARLPPGGRVLDLADADARERVLEAADPARPAPTGADRYDAVVSVAALVTFADLPRALRGIDALLRPDGWFHFAEPVLRPGWRGLLEASAGSLLPPARGLHLGRDVPLALRTEGLLIIDLTRFTMPTWMWPLRSFVAGRARPDFEDAA